MGFFDKIKKALGGNDEPATTTTKAPSQVLRENGIDPGGLKFQFGGRGDVTVNGTVASAEDKARMVEVLEDIDGIESVIDRTQVANRVAEQAPQVGSTDSIFGGAGDGTGSTQSPEPVVVTTETSAEQRIHTVESGDTLWKIAQRYYGDGSEYPRIFEANRDILDDPDKIFPGQELKIPAQEAEKS